jgi:hypothetical protein
MPPGFYANRMWLGSGTPPHIKIKNDAASGEPPALRPISAIAAITVAGPPTFQQGDMNWRAELNRKPGKQ